MIAAVKKNPTDPLASVVSAIGLILSGAGVWSALDLTADQVGMILTGIASLAAALRAVVIARAPGSE